MLDLLERFKDQPGIQITFTWETYQYLMVGEEVEDVCRRYTKEPIIPTITFNELIELSCEIKQHGYTFESHYFQDVDTNKLYRDAAVPYFDLVDQHILRSSSNSRFCIALFWLEEFNYFAVLHIKKGENKHTRNGLG